MSGEFRQKMGDKYMNFAWKCVNYVLSVRVVKTQVMTTRDGSLMSPVGLVAFHSEKMTQSTL